MKALFDKSNLTIAAHGYHYINHHRFKVIEQNDSFEYRALYDLIIALLLYDEVVYLPDSKGCFFKDDCFDSFEDISFFDTLPIYPIEIDRRYIKEAVRHINKTYPDQINTANPFDWKHYRRSSEYLDYCYRFGALEYIYISELLGLTYFPSESRLEFLNYFYDYSNTEIRPGEDLICYTDITVKKFYEEMRAHIEKPSIAFQAPLFLDYLLYNTDEKSNVLQTAMKMRDTKEIRDFRAWIETINHAVMIGDWIEYEKSFRIVEDIVNRILRKSKTLFGCIELTLSWPPSISFPINIKRKSEASKTGSMFIGSLAKFGLTERKYRPDLLYLGKRR